MDIVSTCRVTKLAMDTKTKVNEDSVNPFMYLCVIGALYYGLRKWDDNENLAADKFLRPVWVSENYRSFGLFIISISFKLVWSDDAERCGVGGSFCQ